MERIKDAVHGFLGKSKIALCKCLILIGKSEKMVLRSSKDMSD